MWGNGGRASGRMLNEDEAACDTGALRRRLHCEWGGALRTRPHGEWGGAEEENAWRMGGRWDQTRDEYNTATIILVGVGGGAEDP